METILAIRVEIERLPSDDVQRLIDEGLDIFNAEKVGPDNAEDFVGYRARRQWRRSRRPEGTHILLLALY
jgi:hypothetical protein